MRQRCGVWTRVTLNPHIRSPLESGALESDSLVGEGGKVDTGNPEYGSSDLEPERGSHLDLILNTELSPIEH